MGRNQMESMFRAMLTVASGLSSASSPSSHSPEATASAKAAKRRNKGKGNGNGKGRSQDPNPNKPSANKSPAPQPPREDGWRCCHIGCDAAKKDLVNRPGNAACFSCKCSKQSCLNPPMQHRIMRPNVAIRPPGAPPPTGAQPKAKAAPKAAPNPARSDLSAAPSPAGAVAGAGAAVPASGRLSLPADVLLDCAAVLPAASEILELLGGFALPRDRTDGATEAVDVVDAALKGLTKTPALAAFEEAEALLEEAEQSLLDNESKRDPAACREFLTDLRDDRKKALAKLGRRPPSDAVSTAANLRAAQLTQRAAAQTRRANGETGRQRAQERRDRIADVFGELERQLAALRDAADTACDECENAHREHAEEREAFAKRVDDAFEERIAALPDSGEADAAMGEVGQTANAPALVVAGATPRVADPATAAALQAIQAQLAGVTAQLAEAHTATAEARALADFRYTADFGNAEPQVPAVESDEQASRCASAYKLLRRWVDAGASQPFSVAAFNECVPDVSFGAIVAAVLGDRAHLIWPNGMTPSAVVPRQAVMLTVAALAKAQDRYAALADAHAVDDALVERLVRRRIG